LIAVQNYCFSHYPPNFFTIFFIFLFGFFSLHLLSPYKGMVAGGFFRALRATSFKS